jgi:MFS family permease
MEPQKPQKPEVADLSEPHRLGFGYGLYDFVGSIGIAVGPVLGGFLYETVGGQMPFYLNGFVLLISAGWVLVFLGRHKRDD